MRTFTLIFITLLTLVAHAQNICLDQTFAGGVVKTSFFSDGRAKALTIQPDGKILVVGNDSYRYTLVRYKTDGKRDSTFGGTGIVSNPFLGSNGDGFEKVAVLADGSIIAAGGSGYAAANAPHLVLAKYKATGVLDSTFGTNGSAIHIFGTTDPTGMAIQSDGKIVIGSQDGATQFAIGRFTNTGTVDSTFGTNGKVTLTVSGQTQEIKDIALQADGKVLAGAVRSTFYTENDFVVIRISTNGIIDSTFGNNGFVIEDMDSVDNDLESIKIQPDGKILVGGTSKGKYAGFAGSSCIIVRYNTNGTRDQTFGTNGITPYTYTQGVTIPASGICHAIALHTDGKIIAAGYRGINYDDFLVVRYNSNGSFDNAFGAGGAVLINTGVSSNMDILNDVIVQPDGKIVGTGYINDGSTYQFGTLRLLPNVSVNTDIEDIYSDNLSIAIYPNPVTDHANLSYSLAEDRLVSIELRDITGQIVQTLYTGRQDAGHQELTLDLSTSISKGFYIIQVNDGKMIRSARIAKF